MSDTPRPSKETNIEHSEPEQMLIDNNANKEWGKKAGEWLRDSFKLIFASRAFWLATAAYFAISSAQAYQQQAYIPTYNISPLAFPQNQFALCVRSPSYLAMDGENQHGRVSLKLVPYQSTQPATTTVPIPLDICEGATPPSVMGLTSFYTFAVSASPELLFFDKENSSYSPVISLTMGDETSLLVSNAQLQKNPSNGQFTITYLDNITNPSFSNLIDLESPGRVLWWRKFWEIVLAPAAGAIVALVTVALEELRRREEERRQRDEERQKALDEQQEIVENNRRKIEELRIACEELNEHLDRIGSPLDPVTSSIIDSWLNQLPPTLAEMPVNHNFTEYVKTTIENTVRNYIQSTNAALNELKLSDSVRSKLVNRLTLHKLISHSLRTDLKQSLDEFVIVAAYLQKQKTDTYQFSNPYLAGYCANSLWIHNSNQLVDSILVNYCKQEPIDLEIHRHILLGIFESEQSFLKSHSTPNTLAHELLDDFMNDHVSHTFVWWKPLVLSIETMNEEFCNQVNKTDLYEWCKIGQQERQRQRLIFEQTKNGWSVWRELWPIKPRISSRDIESKGVFDANFDFPVLQDLIADMEFKGIYEQNGRKRKLLAPYDICNDNLVKSAHNVIFGGKGAGKTWLRLYLERFILTTEPKSLPLFYFAPASLLYRTSDIEIAKSLAKSVSNHIFANLLLRSSIRDGSNDPFVASRGAIIPFFEQYGYQVPTEKMSLAQPIPPEELVDIDMAFSKSYLNTIYSQMRQNIEPKEHFVSVEQTLLDIENALDVAGYDRTVILIDNWEHVPLQAGENLIRHLFAEDFLWKLANSKIYLKAFFRNTYESLNSIASFEKNYSLKRVKIDRGSDAKSTDQTASDQEKSGYPITQPTLPDPSILIYSFNKM